MCEPRLKLMVANLMISRGTLRAIPTTANKRKCYSVANPPSINPLSSRFNHTGKLMAWNVRQCNIPVVPHPPMPITATKPGGFDTDDNAII